VRFAAHLGSTVRDVKLTLAVGSPKSIKAITIEIDEENRRINPMGTQVAESGSGSVVSVCVTGQTRQPLVNFRRLISNMPHCIDEMAIKISERGGFRLECEKKRCRTSKGFYVVPRPIVIRS
jgi:hypothetical protein